MHWTYIYVFILHIYFYKCLLFLWVLKHFKSYTFGAFILDWYSLPSPKPGLKMGNLRTLAHAFRKFQTAQIPVSFTVREVQKVEGEEMVKFVVVFSLLSVLFVTPQFLFNIEPCPSTCLQKLLWGKDCVLLLPKQTIIAALVTCGHAQLGRWTAGTPPNLVFCREQTTFRLVFLSCNKYV